MPNEVNIKVTGTNRAKGAFREAKDDARDLENGFTVLGRRMKTSTDDGSNGLRKLATEARVLHATVNRLKAEFARTGDEGLFKGIEKGASRIKEIEGMFKSMNLRVDPDTGGFAKIGAKGAKEFSQGFAGGLADLPQSLLKNPAMGAVAAGMAGPIVAAVSAAVGAGVALGVSGATLAGGIVAAAQDGRVKDAWSRVLDTAKAQFTSRADVFVQPLVNSALIVQGSWERIVPHIGNAFETLSPRIERLASGAGQFLERAFSGKGFERIVDLGGQLMDILAAGLPRLGGAVDSFMNSIANGGEGIKQFFDFLIRGVDLGVRALGKLIEYGSKAWQVFQLISNLMTGNIVDGIDEINTMMGEGTATWHSAGEEMQTTSAYVAQAGEDFNALAEKIGHTDETLSSVTAKMTDQVFNAIMGLDQATLGFAESQTRLADSITQNGLALDIHTAKGQANRESILASVQANMAQYQAMIASGMGADAATEAYESNTAALEDQLRQAGFTQQQIDGLIGKYRSVPRDVSTTIAIQGLENAINGLDATIRRINGIPTRKDIYITQHLATVGGFSYRSPDRLDELAGMQAHGGIVGAAGGGPRSRWTMVGEQGRELVKLPSGSQVIPHGQTEAMAAGAGRGGPQVVELKWTRSGDPLLDEIVKGISARIRTDQATANVFANAGA